jgi:hypothetical protein
VGVPIRGCPGSRSTYAAAQYTASRIPGAKFVGFQDGGHLPVGHDAAVRADVVELLSAPNSAE